MKSRPKYYESHLVHEEAEYPYVKLYRDKLTLHDGSSKNYNRIEENLGRYGVVIMPIRIHDGAIGMVKQYRYPIDSFVWELPRGFSNGGNCYDNAINEMYEETGLKSERSDFIYLGLCYPDSGLLSTAVYTFALFVRNISQKKIQDTDEVTQFSWFSKQNFLKKIASGKISDGLSLSTVIKASSADIW